MSAVVLRRAFSHPTLPSEFVCPKDHISDIADVIRYARIAQ